MKFKHYDKFSTPIQIGDYVVFAYSDGLSVGQVLGSSPKMIRVSNLALVEETKKSNGKHFYPEHVAVVDEEKMIIYLLTK